MPAVRMKLRPVKEPRRRAPWLFRPGSPSPVAGHVAGYIFELDQPLGLALAGVEVDAGGG
jgi:hypothetical protein